MDPQGLCLAVPLLCAAFYLFATATLPLAHQLVLAGAVGALRVVGLRNHTKGL
jgi:hypothetical protein